LDENREDMKGIIRNGLIFPSESLVEHESQQITFSILDLKERPSRSIKQNSYYYGVVIPIIHNHIIETEGIDYATDEIHAFNLVKIAGAKPSIISIGDEEIIHFKIKRTSSMNTKEFSNFIELLIAYWGERGLDIPEPNTNH